MEQKEFETQKTAIDTIVNAENRPTITEELQKTILEKAYSDRISFAKEYEEEQYLLYKDEIGFFAKGDIHGVKAKQKSGKTTAISIMCATLLAGKCFSLKSGIATPKIIAFDTEQKKSDTNLFYHNVFKLAEMEKTDIYNRIQVYNMRTYLPEEMWKAIRTIVETEKPDIIFIDGVVDLVANFNEVTDSQKLIKELMCLSTDTNCAIVCVLHTNKATDDHNMRGHLGTMLSHRCGNILECCKNGDIFTVACTDARHAGPSSWNFKFQDGEIIDADAAYQEQRQQHREEVARQRAERKATEDEQRWQKISKIIGDGISKIELQDKLISEFNVSLKTVKRWIKLYVQTQKIRVEETMDRGTFAYIYI